MKRREFLRVAGLTAGLSLVPRFSVAEEGGKRPNLIYIFADQLRADVLGYSGDKKAITPNIDRFACQSVSFSNAVSVMPVCAAYRASLLTGKYPSGHGMVINELNMNPNNRTIAHVLGSAGYNLGYIGKWHLNDQHARPTPKGPERMGFDGFWAAYNFNHNSYGEYYFTDGPDGKLERKDLKGKHGPTENTSLSMDFLTRATGGSAPFALFLSWNPPHDPWSRSNVAPGNYDKFKDVHFGLPENFKQQPDLYMDRFPGDAFKDRQWKKDFLEGGLEECLRCYYGMVNNLDDLFGRIMEHLEKLGVADDTIVVFSSDHGEMFASQGRMYKLTFYDEAARVPLLVRYPKKVKPGISDACINTPDIMPTLLGLMGLTDRIPAEVEGKNLDFVLRGEKGAEPDAAFLQGMGHTYLWSNGYEWRAVRDKRFTYAKYHRDGRELLFDRQKDPTMKKDVAGDVSYAVELARLRKIMAAKMSELKDDFHECTWYRDHWMYRNYSVKSSARGDFGPLPPVEPLRNQRG